tara:strand:+ start:1012 stop:1200 length:189 start_codon:yes stop_codon:yes gene_type:complete
MQKDKVSTIIYEPDKGMYGALSEYDYSVILPWHCKEFFLSNKKLKDEKLIFPLPIPEIITVK